MLSLPGSGDVAMVPGMQYHVAEEKGPSVGPGRLRATVLRKRPFCLRIQVNMCRLLKCSGVFL